MRSMEQHCVYYTDRSTILLKKWIYCPAYCITLYHNLLYCCSCFVICIVLPDSCQWTSLMLVRITLWRFTGDDLWHRSPLSVFIFSCFPCSLFVCCYHWLFVIISDLRIWFCVFSVTCHQFRYKKVWPQHVSGLTGHSGLSQPDT